MTDSAKPHVNYFSIWVWLIALTIGYILERFIGIPRNVALLAIFGIALLKALLVALNFMHLRWESPMIYMIVLVPIVLFGILLILLLPDITFIHTGGK